MSFSQKLQVLKVSPQIHNIIRIGDQNYKNLAKRSQSINGMSERFKNIIESLKLTAAKENAISLSCPQIGINFSIVVMLKNLQNDWGCNNVTPTDYITLINPIITKESKLQQVAFEQCPTFPFMMAKMLRAQKIHYEYRNENFEIIKEQASSFKARVIQHEIDHLIGKSIDQVNITLRECQNPSFRSNNINTDNLKKQSAGLQLVTMQMKLKNKK